jgi:chemotaxis protein MotD
MTSGVKQALPQVLMPKAGVEGKAISKRAPQGDFAETLGMGKIAKQLKSAESKADLQEIEAKPLWQRLAAKLDTAAEHSKVIAAKLEAAATSEEPEAEEPTGDRLGKLHKSDRAEDMAASPAARPSVDAAQAPIPPIASGSVPATTAEPTDATPQRDAAAFQEEPPPPAKRNVIVDDRQASPPASSETAGKQDSAAPAFVPMGRGEQAESIRFEPAARSAAPAEPTDGSHASDAVSDNTAEPARTAPRVTILAQQNIPAPMPSTAIVLVESIAASDLLEPAKTVLSLDAIHASAAPASAQSLKIQLHPAELGMVTATLRFAGEQLSIELQVENHEAYRRLTSDSDTIVSSLRDLGYDIERVTVLQPSLASTPASRSDTGASMPSPQGRAPDQSGSGTTSGGNGGTGGRQPDSGGNAGRNGSNHPSAARENPESGLYI